MRDIAVSCDDFAPWRTILRAGAEVLVPRSMSVDEFMIGHLEIDPEYAANRIMTVFRNSSPVDDTAVEPLAEGDVLALGAAMPGLVGICMGKGSPLKDFRDDISAHGTAGATTEDPFLIRLKLFNHVAAEIGADIFARGVVLESRRLADFLRNKAEDLADCSGTFDNERMTAQGLARALENTGEDRVLVRLNVRS